MSTHDAHPDFHPIPSRLSGPVGVVVSLLLRLGYTLRAADGASVSGAVHSTATLAAAISHLSIFPTPGTLVALNVHAPPDPAPFSLAPCVVCNGREIAEAHMPVNSAGHAYQPGTLDDSPDAARPEPLGPVVGRVTVAHEFAPAGPVAYYEALASQTPLGTLAAVAAGALAIDASFLLEALWPGGRLAANASPRERNTHAFLSRVLALRDFVAPPPPAPTPARSALALRVLDVVEAWIAERRVSSPESILQVDDVNQSLPDFAESLAALVGWHRDTSDLDA